MTSYRWVNVDKLPLADGGRVKHDLNCTSSIQSLSCCLMSYTKHSLFCNYLDSPSLDRLENRRDIGIESSRRRSYIVRSFRMVIVYIRQNRRIPEPSVHPHRTRRDSRSDDRPQSSYIWHLVRKLPAGRTHQYLHTHCTGHRRSLPCIGTYSYRDS